MASDDDVFVGSVQIATESFDLPIDYPSKYFQHNKQKPSVSLPYKNVDLETLRPVVVKSIKDGSITNDMAALFLVKFGERFKATLADKWESFGVIISEPGEVKLSSIIDIKFGDEEIPSSPEKVELVSSNDDDSIASFLTSIYRINRAKNEKYRLELSKTALSTLIKNRASGLNNNLNFTKYINGYWTQYGNYCKLIAAYDMFLHKTKIQKYQFLRWGTISSRYRDCPVLSTWIDISNACGYNDLSDLGEWIFARSIGRDMEIVLKDGEEIDKPDSYMPYLADLGLSCRSPYRCTANPALHMFLSTMKVYLGQKGASNTKKFDCDMVDVCSNGLIVAYALRKKYYSANKNQVTENPSVSCESDPALEAVSTADEMFAYLQNKGTFDFINGPLEKFKKSIDVTIINPKRDTVGYFLTHTWHYLNA